jgi:NAD(P)-dependent dehydrogenase (short-subunit alcohol dehydrogenase family)
VNLEPGQSGSPATDVSDNGRRELIVVVGATGAFGKVIVQRLVDAGFGVVAVGRNADRLDFLVEVHGEAVHPCPTDIGADFSVAELRAAIAATGRADVEPTVRAIVHGPGSVVAGGIIDAPIDALTRSVDIKVGGLLRAVRAADPYLVDGSRIIAIAGHYGLEPSPYAASAGIANAALFSAVRQLSLAYGHRGVTAHTLAPGPSDTDRLHRVAADRAARDGITTEAVLDAMRAESSIGRLTTPEQVAWAVSMLLAPEAAAMTGSTVMLDSGRRKGLP